MIPKRVVLENFLSFASPAVTFDFSGADEALWVITGPNGCGKSAVFDGITYALFECHRGGERKKQDLLMRHGADHYQVILEFDFAGRSYRITRGRSRTGKTTKPLQKLEEQTAQGTWRPLDEGNSSSALTKWVVDTLGLDYDSFTASVLLRQGASDKLLSGSKEESLKILKGIIGFEQYEALSERVREETSAVRATAANLKARFQTLVAVSVDELAFGQYSVHETEARRTSAQLSQTSAIQRVERSKVWQKCHARSTELENRLADAGCRAVRADIIRVQKARGDELGTVVPLLQSLVKGRQELARLQDILEDRQSLQKDAGKRSDAARTLAFELIGQLEHHKSTHDSIDRELGEIAEGISNIKKVYGQTVELEKLAGEVSRYPVDLPARLNRATELETGVDTELRSADQRLTEARTRLKTIRDERDEFRTVQDGVECSRCGQTVTAAHAEIERARMADGVATWMSTTAERQAVVNDLQGRSAKAKTERIGIAQQSAERDRFLAKFETQQASLTAQGCVTRAAGLLAEQGTLESRGGSIRTQQLEAKRLKQTLEASAQEQTESIQKSEIEVKDLDAQIADATTKRAGLLGGQSSDVARLATAWVERWPTLTEHDVQTVEQELGSIRASAVEHDFQNLLVDDAQSNFWNEDRIRVQSEIDGILESDRISPEVAEVAKVDAGRLSVAADAEHRVAVAALEDSLKRAGEYRRVSAELAEAQLRLSQHETLEKLLGKDGIQLDLVREAETEVIALADDTLRRLSNQELSLEADDEATGKDLKAFALRIRKVGESKPTGVDFISGSQRFRVAVSLALAIGRFAAGKQRPIEAVIIDEGFGSLDKDGLRAMAENLHELRRTQSLKRIILVSHQESFTDQFTNGYKLTPSESGTTVERIG